jgi:phage baseplate assembly protein W
MMGMDERTGKVLRGSEWVQQGIRRGLRTRKGSRFMARWYGTDYMRQLGRSISAGSILDLTSDLADSIESTIPGARLMSVIEQENGERMRVYFRVGDTSMNVDV